MIYPIPRFPPARSPLLIAWIVGSMLVRDQQVLGLFVYGYPQCRNTSSISLISPVEVPLIGVNTCRFLVEVTRAKVMPLDGIRQVVTRLRTPLACTFSPGRLLMIFRRPVASAHEVVVHLVRRANSTNTVTFSRFRGTDRLVTAEFSAAVLGHLNFQHLRIKCSLHRSAAGSQTTGREIQQLFPLAQYP